MRTSTGALRLLITVLAALLVALLLPSASPEIVGSRLFELISQYKPAAEPFPAVVLLEADPQIEPVEYSAEIRAELFLVLAEMEAEEAIVTLSEEQPGATSMLNRKEDINNRLDEEFELIKDNVAALFEGIRYGSVRPQDAEDFIDELLDLIDNSGGRLRDDVLNSEAKSAAYLKKARGVFGEQQIGEDPVDLGYTFPEYKDVIVAAEFPPGEDIALPFRRLPLRLVYKYKALEQELNLLLETMEEAGFFGGMRPELRPTILDDEVNAILSRLLDDSQELTKRNWLDAKKNYLKSVEALLTGDRETELDEGFAALLTDEEIAEEQARRIAELRQIIAETFTETRRVYAEFSHLRDLLFSELFGSCCIIGTAAEPGRNREDIWQEPTDAEMAAAHIHSVRLHRFNMILTAWKEKASLAGAGLIIALILGVLSLPLVFPIGFLVTAATAMGVILLYVNTGIFIHPLYVALVQGITMIASCIVGLVQRKTPREKIVQKRCVVLAVRCLLREEQSAEGDSVDGALFLKDFHRAVTRGIKRHGGIVVGSIGTVVLAGFGTPFNSDYRRRSNSTNHVQTAIRAAEYLSQKGSGIPAEPSFGVDIGDCYFFVSPVTGYSVKGKPAAYARILSELAMKYDCRILFTEEIRQEIKERRPTKKLHSVVEKTSGRQRAFYAFTDTP